MLSNDVLILREAIGKLINKLEGNEEITADETNAVVEAFNKCVGSIHKINAMKPGGPTEGSQFAQAEYECFRNVHKLLKQKMAKTGRYPDGKEVVRKLRLAHPDLFCPPTAVEPRRSTILAAAEARVAVLAHTYREQGEERSNSWKPSARWVISDDVPGSDVTSSHSAQPRRTKVQYPKYRPLIYTSHILNVIHCSEPTTLLVTLRTRTGLVPMWMMRMRGLTQEASTPTPSELDWIEPVSPTQSQDDYEDVDDSGSEGVDGSGSEVGSVVSDEMDLD